ncbi:MAG TPA: hypothetical protein VFL63_12720 [Rhodanobacteraceae bacterium]|nr:hypothetical protein [Rhodanobacteraceae bacterium]
MNASEPTDATAATPPQAGADATPDGIHRVEINDLLVTENGQPQLTRHYLVDGKPADNLDALPPAMQAEVKRMLAADAKTGGTESASPSVSVRYIEPDRPQGLSMKSVVIGIAVLLALAFALGKLLH